MDSPSARAEVRFYAELNDHLPEEFRYRSLERMILVADSVEEMIESCGVPHTEVELIIANGQTVDFSYVVRAGDRIAVYPMFESLDVTPELRVRPAALREPRFVVDAHLGRLTAYLRMLGFDALYPNSYEDSELATISSEQRRILLTRDAGVLERSAVSRGYRIRETDSRRQLKEVIRRFDLERLVRPFTRCIKCNEVNCGRIYRQGARHSRMERWILKLVSA